MKRNLTTILVLLAVYSGISIAQQSVSFSREITVTSSGFTAKVVIGVNGDGVDGSILDNTIGGDVDMMFGGLYSAPWSEEQAPPPPPPPFDIDVRLLTPPGRTTAWPAGLGGGMYNDFRGFSSSSQIDTFRIQIAGDAVENNGASITWTSDLAAVASSWQIKGQNAATPLALTDMVAASSGVAIDAQGGTLLVLIFVTNYNTGVGVERIGESAGTYTLDSNYPNPFNPSTAITYSIPNREMVSLEVYNAFGQVVRRIVQEMQEPGFYTAQFDGTGLTSGVYYYRLQAGPYSSVRSMMLVK